MSTTSGLGCSHHGESWFQVSSRTRATENIAAPVADIAINGIPQNVSLGGKGLLSVELLFILKIVYQNCR